MKNVDSPWYQSWFNTPYYHLLYHKRNDAEAAFFLDNLCAHLQLKSGATTWDMACGKGRHAIYLANKGFNSIGTDLSGKSIEEASKTQMKNLSFYVHDMRNPLRINYFDCVFNIFTSMGYFSHRRDDERVFISAALGCKSGGYFVVDFMNAVRSEKKLVKEETREYGGIEFHIKRKLEHRIFVKEISFRADSHNWLFEEKVRAYVKDELVQMGTKAGFTLQNVFGNYSLEKFSENDSDRLILVFKK